MYVVVGKFKRLTPLQSEQHFRGTSSVRVSFSTSVQEKIVGGRGGITHRLRVVMHVCQADTVLRATCGSATAVLSQTLLLGVLEVFLGEGAGGGEAGTVDSHLCTAGCICFSRFLPPPPPFLDRSSFPLFVAWSVFPFSLFLSYGRASMSPCWQAH